MRARALAALLVALLAALGAVTRGDSGGSAGAKQPAGARCHIVGSGDLIRPDDRCTPGEYLMLTREEACRHKDRPSLPAAEKRRIISQYGYRSWAGRNGELDHRVPFFLGGATTEDNLWPETGPIPNRKDRVEMMVYERVCSAGSMTVRQGREVFLGDWTRYR